MMKKINKQFGFDFGLLFLTLLGWVNLFYFFTSYNSQTLELSAFYWSFFSILLIDRLFFKRINNILFWKAVFVTGIVIFVIDNITRVIPQLLVFMQAVYSNNVMLYFVLGSSFFLLFEVITLLLIYRSYKFISKGV